MNGGRYGENEGEKRREEKYQNSKEQKRKGKGREEKGILDRIKFLNSL